MLGQIFGIECAANRGSGGIFGQGDDVFKAADLGLEGRKLATIFVFKLIDDLFVITVFHVLLLGGWARPRPARPCN